LRQLVARLRESGAPTDIRIVGGAALALRYFERESTVDIDAHFIGATDIVEEAARAIARANGLMAICGVTTLDQAEELYEEYYSGEVLPERAIRMVEMILRVGVPDSPAAPADVVIAPRD